MAKLTGKSVDDLKAEALQVLGEEEYTRAAQLNIAEINKLYGAAHQRFDDVKAKAYENMFTVKMLGGGSND